MGLNINASSLAGLFGGNRTRSFEPRTVTPERKAVYESDVKAWLGSMPNIGPLDSVKLLRQATRSDIQGFEKQQKGDNVTDFKNSVAHSLYNHDAPFLLEVTQNGKKATVLAFEYEGGKHLKTWPRDIVWSDAGAQKPAGGWKP